MATAAQRNTQSRAKIRAAFITLMKKKGFDAMTVSDIAREAGINRGTFYLHYVDKYDLRQQLIDDEISTLTSILLNGNGNNDGKNTTESPDYIPSAMASDATSDDYIPQQAILLALRHISQELDFFQAISNDGRDMQLYNQLKTILGDLLTGDTAESRHTIGTPGIPERYAKELAVTPVVSVIWLWLTDGCDESPETVANILQLGKRLCPLDLLQ